MKAKYVPEGSHTVTPYLTVPDAGLLIEFLKKAFDGVEREKLVSPDGTVFHAAVLIGDSLVMIGQPRSPRGPQPSMLYLYVPDVDATYERAIAAGAKSVSAPADMFYGDRTSCVKDMAGNEWWIATHIEDLTIAQIQERATAMFSQGAK